MSGNRVEARESKDGRFRWMLVGEDGTAALGVGAWERAEEAEEAGRMAIGDARRVRELEVELDGAYGDLEEHQRRAERLESEVATAAGKLEECEKLRGSLKAHFEGQLKEMGQRNQALSEALAERDKEHMDLKQVAAVESAKVNECQREVAALEAEVEAREQSLLWYCGGWALAGGVVGGLLTYWGL